MGEIYQGSTKKYKIKHLASLLSDKVGFKAQSIVRNKES